MTYASVLVALADPTRRAIFESLRNRPQSVSGLAMGRTISRPAVSQHLKVLAEAGLVKAEARGAANIYRALPGGLQDLRDYLDAFWGDVLEAFAAEVAQQQGCR